VQMHDMGKVAAIGSADELAQGLLAIFADKGKYRCDTDALAGVYDPMRVAQDYERLFEGLLRKKGRR